MRFSHGAVALFAGLTLTACVTSADDHLRPSVALVGEEWIVEDIAARGVVDFAQATIEFGQDGRLSGNSSCNNYFAGYQVDGAQLAIEHSGATTKMCPPAVMDQESRFLSVFNAVESYKIDATGALVLSAPSGATITARRASGATPKTTYRCTDGTLVEVWYPTTDNAKIVYQGQTISMMSAISASGARYVGDGWQWWTKGMTEGMLSPLSEGETITSAGEINCSAR